MTHLLGIKAALNTTKPQQSVLDAIAGGSCAGGRLGRWVSAPWCPPLCFNSGGFFAAAVCPCCRWLVPSKVLSSGGPEQPCGIKHCSPCIWGEEGQCLGGAELLAGGDRGGGFGAVGAGMDCG